MKNLRISLSPFVRAWELLFDLPLPSFMANIDNDAEDTPTALCFPVTGAIIGIGLLFSCWIINIIPGKPAGPYISAVLIAIGLESITGFRSIASMISFIELKVKKISTPDALNYISNDIGAIKSSQSLLLLISLFLIRLFCLGFFVIYEHTSWIVSALIINFAVQALLTNTESNKTGNTIFDHDDTFEKKLWFVTAILMLIFGGSYFFPTLLTLGVIIFCSYKFKKYSTTMLNEINGTLIGFIGYCAEFITIIIGLTFLFH